MIRDTDPDNVYYNLTIRHSRNTVSNEPAIYRSEQVTPILSNASKYYCSIVRFSVPGYNIPLLIFPIQNNQSNPLLSDLSVTLTYNGETVQQFLIFQPRIAYTPVPTDAIPTQKVSPYYYIYEYQHFIDIVNAALLAAYNLLSVTPTGSEPPYFIYNPETQLISFICTKIGYIYTYTPPVMNPPPDPNPPDISVLAVYINKPLAQYFQGIAVLGFSSSAPFGMYELIYVTDTGNNSYTPPDIAVGYPQKYLQIEQQYFTLDNWNVFQNLIFTTLTIPVVKEFIQSSDINDATETPILTDFNPYLGDRAGSFRSILSYFPQGPYRLTDMISNDPLRKIDLFLYWQDKTNNLYPLLISPGQEVNVKILFIKKDVIKRSGYNFLNY